MLNSKALAASVSAPPAVYVEDVFSTWLYTGNGSTQTITNGIDLSGQGGLIWTKVRNIGYSNALVDTSRGTNYVLCTDRTDSQFNYPDISSFNSTGYTIGQDYSAWFNASSKTYASWTFRKQAKFFDVVTWTATGSTQTINHNLGSVPGVIIVKKTSNIGGWNVYHRSTGENASLFLNNTNPADTGVPNYWNGTAPTATQFTVGDYISASGQTYVAYLFAHDAGGFGDSGNESVIKCGSFSATGVIETINLGWEPQWILVKSSSAAGDWFLVDVMRGAANQTTDATNSLSANTSAAEAANNFKCYPTATGFQMSVGSGTYIYIAIRRGPMKTPTDATKVFAPLARTGNGSSTYVLQSGFSTDSAVHINRNAGYGWYSADRLRGLTTLSYNTTGAESSAYPIAGWDAANNNGVIVGNTNNAWNENGGSLLYYSFRRAPGFCDVVAYAGTGAVQQINHSLGVKPELLFVKVRSTSGRNWIAAIQGNGGYLNTNDAFSSGITFINLTTQSTTTTFRVDASAEIGGTSNTYIAYLFASCPGVSKVGSYTGTGTTLSIDCGFTNGSRLVMIKRTDSTGSWYVWDTARGIVSGNDSYLLLNSTAAEVTNTDYIDPLASGFEISSTAPAEINANGGSFIFFAVA